MSVLSTLSVFFPAYNDAKTIPTLVKRAYQVAPKVAKRFEVIVINDGSTDDTARMLYRLKKRYPCLRVVTHAHNRGYGAALRSGFRKSRYAWVFYTDGDGQYDPMELVKLVRALKQRKEVVPIDVVNVYKIKRADPLLRIVLGNIYNWWTHQRATLPIRDIDCDFRLMRRSMLEKLHLTSSSGTICMELITKLDKIGAHFAEVPIHHYPRRFGRSQFFQPRHLWKTLKEALRSSP